LCDLPTEQIISIRHTEYATFQAVHFIPILFLNTADGKQNVRRKLCVKKEPLREKHKSKKNNNLELANS